MDASELPIDCSKWVGGGRPVFVILKANLQLDEQARCQCTRDNCPAVTTSKERRRQMAERHRWNLSFAT